MKYITLGNSNLKAIVDDEDYSFVVKYNWCLGDGAVCGWVEGKSRKLHNFVLGITIEDGLETDHKDRNYLNCQKGNLRRVTHSINLQNKAKTIEDSSSKYKGVYKNNGRGKPWIAEIRKDGKKVSLGRFNSEKEAAKAYNIAAKQLYGPLANINKIQPETIQ